MDPISAVIAFSIPAALLTVMPGLDTALVVRSRRAMLAGSEEVSDGTTPAALGARGGARTTGEGRHRRGLRAIHRRHA